MGDSRVPAARAVGSRDWEENVRNFLVDVLTMREWDYPVEVAHGDIINNGHPAMFVTGEGGTFLVTVEKISSARMGKNEDGG